MNGSAPKSPETGSQVRVVQKRSPNSLIDSHDWRVSSTPIAATSTTSSNATEPIAMRKPNSRRTSGIRSGNLDRAERGHFLLNDTLGDRRVAHLGRHFLAVGQRPFHEVD